MPLVTDRISVSEMLIHQHPDQQPTAIEHRFSRSIKSDEQPYIRKTKVSEEWINLDFGWVENVGMLHLVNEEGGNLQTIPTEEELQALALKVIEIRHESSGFCWLILPGESFRGMPSTGNGLQVRCQSGIAKYTINIFPG